MMDEDEEKIEELAVLDEITLSSDYQELTRDEVIRLQALDMSVSSKPIHGASTWAFLERAEKFENYIRNGEIDGA